MNKKTAIAVISVLSVLVISLGILYLVNIKHQNGRIQDQNDQIQELSDSVGELSKQIDTLNDSISEKNTQIEVISKELDDKASQIDALNKDLSIKTRTIETQNETILALEQRISSLQPKQNENSVYPRYCVSSLLKEAQPLPEICYTTPASENGYKGFPCYVTGTVTKIYKEGEFSSTVPQMVVLSTENGPVYFVVTTPEFMVTHEPGLNTEEEKAAFLAHFDTTLDYTLPKVGETVTIYGAYRGFSGALNMAGLDFGIDDYIYNLQYGIYSPEKYEGLSKTKKQ